MIRPAEWLGYERPEPQQSSLRCHVAVVVYGVVDG